MKSVKLISALLIIISILPAIAWSVVTPDDEIPQTQIAKAPIEDSTKSEREASSKPNLIPYKQLSGWSDTIVVSTSTGTNTDNSITSEDDIYIDWAVLNDSDIEISSKFYIAIYIDDIYSGYWYTDVIPAGYYVYVKDHNIGRLSAGVHKIKIVADYTGVIDESDETDNEYIKTIMVFEPLKEVKIDSVYPSIGKMGEDLKVTIKSSGFDKNTRLSMAVDAGNSAKIIGSVATLGDAHGVTVVGSLAYIADGGSGLQVVDISNPANPAIIGQVDTPGYAWQGC